jgi:hypothetical protein
MYRFAAANRRVTGVATELPAGVRLALTLLIGACALVFCVWGLRMLFVSAYYFKTQPLFVLKDVRNDVTISTGKMLTPDLICEVLGLRDGVNLFSIDIDRKRRELLEMAPNIRNITIVRGMPAKLKITITERDPIACVGSNGRVVDTEGVVFSRNAGIGGLPLITSSDEFAHIVPGDRLGGNELNAVKLIANTLRPDCQARLQAVDAGNPDYLMLTFSDSRKAKLAWDGMFDGQKNTESRMQRQLDNLIKAMSSDIGMPRMMWDATLPNRIFAMPIIHQ